MAIKRYVANADTTVTNAFGADLRTRGTGSNMGASDSLEVFSIYGQVVSGSNATKTSELSRILVNFPVGNMETDRSNGDLPASGSVEFYLRMFNAEHPLSLPQNFTLSASAITREWEEGFGLDMEGYTDITKEGTGASWMHASKGASWTRVGGDYDLWPTSSFEQAFVKGTEDLEMNITSLVEQWLYTANADVGDKSSERYGIGIYLTSSQEAYFSGSSEADGTYRVISGTPIFHNLTGSKQSYYTKKFFARGSEYFFKRPIIEARWDSSTKDNRGNFYLSSSLAPAADNLMTLYLYNFVRGQLKNIPGLGGRKTPKYNAGGDIKNTKLLVTIFSGSSDNTAPSGEKLAFSIGGGTQVDLDTFTTASWFATGSYSASFAFTGSSTLTKIWDVWYTSSVGAAFPSTQNQFFTGTVNIENLRGQNHNPNQTYAISMPNFRQKYSNSETARFRLSARKKDWNPTIYTKATNTAETSTVEDAYYKIYRVKDDYTVIDYGTGSSNHTRLSYDTSGSFFDLDTSLLEDGYMYGVKYVFYENGKYTEQSDTFKFKVE
jgi:hypothetical protein